MGVFMDWKFQTDMAVYGKLMKMLWHYLKLESYFFGQASQIYVLKFDVKKMREICCLTLTF